MDQEMGAVSKVPKNIRYAEYAKDKDWIPWVPLLVMLINVKEPVVVNRMIDLLKNARFDIMLFPAAEDSSTGPGETFYMILDLS